jgi:predicted TIM-barrel fold metal-dependent hydrolase
MSAQAACKTLLSEIERFQIIDAHEHLGPERTRTEAQVDVFTLFAHYTHADLVASGMRREEYDSTQNPSLPLDERWATFRPYWENIRFGSYARAALIAARHFYGHDDISDATYQPLSDTMAAMNVPGIYNRVLRDACRIRVALTQCGTTDVGHELLAPLMPLGTHVDIGSREQAERVAAEMGVTVRSLEDYVQALRVGTRRWKEQGAVGLKMTASPLAAPSREDAESAFNALLANRPSRDLAPLHAFLTHAMIDIAEELDLVVAVHSGIIWTNWQDFTALHPAHLIPTLLRHREARFDVYHAGIPYCRELGVMGKTFPNLWLNLCWCHIVSPAMTRSTLDEWLDLVPINKIIAFGGDYCKPVEKVYGHLVMAREDIARVLAGRVADGLLTEKQAVAIAHKWFFENPNELYRLNR